MTARPTLYLAAALLLVLLPSCATTAPDWHPPMTADTVWVPASTTIGKLKARTVIYQLGTGNVATANDNRKAGQHQGSAATAPDATASNASKRTAGPPWWVYGLVAAVGAALWEWARSLLPFRR